MKMRTSPWHAAIAAVLTAASGAALVPATAQAAAPMVKTQAPGYYRMMLGDFELTVLSDGTVDLPVDKLLTNIKPPQLEKALSRAHLKAPVETSVNTFLINTGAQLVLVDTGAGNLFGPTLGKLLANLKAAGYQPEQIDAVLITHLHPDHLGGLLAGDKRAFPNATVHLAKAEADFWMSAENMKKAPADAQSGFQNAMAMLTPYATADKLKPFEGDTELVPGIKAISNAGHTPGHSNYAVESKGQKLVLWGDLLHVASVQFADPSVTIQFDSDSKAAAAQRKKAFADAAKQGYWVGAAHVSFPGIGHVTPEGKGYVYVPANYTTKQ
ncbi:MBL fold metallo-hydrolase [Archangium lansingense]|uniref:MBL fold metallo-hydrolase n=1 Tax=Archangium lansingense TaxID=2995310 RepID=A0ABT4A3X6_9BACT|nr:MBL fold metallo-hydrolase [Archangium lansinium]MCY1076345.1 MBL fold metallo-hydrolase [Archangium lansinium]